MIALMVLVEVISDWVIALSYFAIPIELIFFYLRYRVQQRAAAVVLCLFVLFITLCGFTHLFGALHLGEVNKLCKGLTAIVSLITACALIRVIPVVFAMPVELARLDEDYSHELNLRVFNQTIVLCTRHLNEPHAVRLAAETLKYMFPAGRLAIVERDVQFGSGLTEIPIDVRYVLLVEPWLYQQHARFFQEVASQISMQGRVATKDVQNLQHA